ncbi:MAG: hypothetical protein QOI63_978 [Thermoplasmata archaeon]|nr:hypothetical protein [Thermoplasmata archaeon]
MTRHLDSRGRLTIDPRYRSLLDGPVEQLETEEGILLRPAPSAQEGLHGGTSRPTSLSPVEQRS